ncbi:MAG: bifunctional DNA-binding transcriptional regulator/O6-methylguanine-DNA methyltransferase Ada [Myxococcales bacterium]|nr:bifunctional DNA-binding transcriptional regulator/O6-methylguanine-DNA methyltransferase Ada [Myxococcales bacterium]
MAATERITDRRWQAVLERDEGQNGRFFYGVSTTGVFCRPTCPSRRPLRKHVSFFATEAQARKAGFRACLRCRPEAGEGCEARHDKVVAACRYIEAQRDRVPTLAELGAQVGLSATHLQRVFKRTLGVSPRQYADALRLGRFKRELSQGESVTGAIFGAGYGSTSRLYETANAKLGMTPRSYRGKARGETIDYVTVASPLGGYLLVAGTSRGLCAVRLGDRARSLVAELREEFAGATLRRGDESMREPLQALLGYLAGEAALPDLPCDVRATAFQRRVWEAIREIPAGETATYSELAASVGNPKAVRAVARACASNPTALVVPCHRVVPKTGGIGGYRWGPSRKRALLAREKRQGS